MILLLVFYAHSFLHHLNWIELICSFSGGLQPCWGLTKVPPLGKLKKWKINCDLIWMHRVVHTACEYVAFSRVRLFAFLFVAIIRFAILFYWHLLWDFNTRHTIEPVWVADWLYAVHAYVCACASELTSWCKFVFGFCACECICIQCTSTVP